ncbi:MAG: TlpA family protein disulfide reductase [Synergistaceae bacterium]|jgi:thiol-disulfide isomerase/thioredoxin|nr:TlpA family protein disulfide reductase [Synergistaceae bacterium]
MKKYLGAVVVAVFLLAVMGAEAQDAFPAFSTKSLTGEQVTNSIFAEKKLTMLNFWATWCPPCLDEMPDLGRLARTMPDGSQLIGVLIDVEDQESIDEAQEILKETKADFLQILPVEEMNFFLRSVTAIPTTIFVDSQGKIVGSPLIGSRSEAAYRAAVEAALKSLQ